jgi:hypothetical protein
LEENAPAMNFTGAWKEAFKLWPEAFRRAWVWSFLVAIVDIGVSAGLGVVRDMDPRLEVPGAILGVLLPLALSFFVIPIMNQIIANTRDHTRVDVMTAFNKHFKHITIENFRAMLAIALKMLLLIVPGLVEILRLVFINYVVQFDPDYQKGNVDALAKSRGLIRGRFWLFALNFAIMGVLVSVLVTLSDIC